jgi:hypothetical protein
MGVIDKIINLVGGDPHAETAQAANAPEDTYLGTQLSTTGVVLEPSTAEKDPALRDVGSDGVPVDPRDVEIEREQDLEARRYNDSVRRD